MLSNAQLCAKLLKYLSPVLEFINLHVNPGQHLGWPAACGPVCIQTNEITYIDPDPTPIRIGSAQISTTPANLMTPGEARTLLLLCTVFKFTP